MLKKNHIGNIVYVVTAILYFITIFISYKSVSANLDGWHGFRSEHAIVFVIICALMIVLCIHNAVSLWIDGADLRTNLIGVILIVFPLLSHIVSVGFKGNIETDLQYFMLRSLQGFESTYIYLIILSLIGYVNLIGIKLSNNEN